MSTIIEKTRVWHFTGGPGARLARGPHLPYARPHSRSHSTVAGGSKWAFHVDYSPGKLKNLVLVFKSNLELRLTTVLGDRAIIVKFELSPVP